MSKKALFLSFFFSKCCVCLRTAIGSTNIEIKRNSLRQCQLLHCFCCPRKWCSYAPAPAPQAAVPVQILPRVAHRDPRRVPDINVNSFLPFHGLRFLRATCWFTCFPHRLENHSLPPGASILTYIISVLTLGNIASGNYHPYNQEFIDAMGANTRKKWFCYGNKIRDNK